MNTFFHLNEKHAVKHLDALSSLSSFKKTGRNLSDSEMFNSNLL